MDYQIFATLQEAEDTVATLRKLIEEKTENAADSSEQPATKHKEMTQNPRSISSSPQLYTKYMTNSTVKLFESEGLEVFRIADSVGLYSIVPNNRVKTAARSALLRIVRLSDEFVDESRPPAFLQVGEWIYPLMKGSMVYRSEHKYYLFPDLLATTPGQSVGVVLPKSCSPEQRQDFETLLLALVQMDEFPVQTPDAFGKSTELILNARTSVSLVRTNSGVYSTRSSQIDLQGNRSYGKRIGAGIKAGGQLLSRGFELGAVGTAHVMTLGTMCLKSAISKEEHDRDIPSSVVDGIVYAKELTGRVVDISSSILGVLSNLTANLASQTACYIKTTSGPFVGFLVDSTGISPATLDEITSEVKDIGNGIVKGGLAAYSGLETAANIMADALNSNAVDVVTHCYGPSSARVLQNATEVVGNIVLSGINKNHVLSPCHHLSRTTKQAGIALALDDCSGASSH